MRRKRQELSESETLAILRRSTHGVMALVDEDGEPYAVPLSHALVERDDGPRLLFHCAREGAKLRCLAHEPRVSFCVVDEDDVVPERFTTHFRSAIAFGRARVLQGGEEAEAPEVRAALEAIAGKYSPGIDPTEEIAGALARVAIIEMRIERLTGKQAKELILRSGGREL